MSTELHAAWRVFIGLKKHIFDIKNTFSRFPTYTMQPQRPAGEEPSRPRHPHVEPSSAGKRILLFEYWISGGILD